METIAVKVMLSMLCIWLAYGVVRYFEWFSLLDEKENVVHVMDWWSQLNLVR